MTIISRKVDESLMIGKRLMVKVTDIDSTGARLWVRGQCVGGPDDGQELNRAFELGISGELRLGDLIRINIARVAVTESRVYLSVHAPKHFEVLRKEVFDTMSRDSM